MMKMNEWIELRTHGLSCFKLINELLAIQVTYSYVFD